MVKLRHVCARMSFRRKYPARGLGEDGRNHAPGMEMEDLRGGLGKKTTESQLRNQGVQGCQEGIRNSYFALQ